jgi:hypothetical protein
MRNIATLLVPRKWLFIIIIRERGGARKSQHCKEEMNRYKLLLMTLRMSTDTAQHSYEGTADVKGIMHPV